MRFSPDECPVYVADKKRSEEKEFDFAITFKLKILPFAERPFNLESLHLSLAIIWS